MLLTTRGRAFVARLAPRGTGSTLSPTTYVTIAALQVLAIVQDSAEALGLAALASLVRGFHGAPLTAAIPDLLALEAARIRFVPTLKHAS